MYRRICGWPLIKYFLKGHEIFYSEENCELLCQHKQQHLKKEGSYDLSLYIENIMQISVPPNQSLTFQPTYKESALSARGGGFLVYCNV